MIKTTPKYTFGFSSMSLHLKRLVLAYPLSYFMRPAKSQCQNRYHLLQSLCLAQPGLLKAESSFLKTSEQCLDLPTPRIIFYSSMSHLATCHDQILSTFKLHPRYVQMLPDHSPRSFKLNRLAYAASRKQACGSHHLPVTVSDHSICSQTYAKIYTVLFQMSEQFLTDKLAISAQKVNRIKAEESVKLTQQSHSLSVVGASSLFKQNPQQRESRAFVADAEREDVNRRRGKAPIRAINTDDPGSGHPDQLNNKASDARITDLKATQETLDTFIGGISRSRATESRSNLSEVDSPDPDQGDEELSQEVDTSFVPSYIRSKRSLKRANVGHCAISFQEHLVMISIRITARWPLCIFKELFLSCT
jgi:hypothetical protein